MKIKILSPILTLLSITVLLTSCKEEDDTNNSNADITFMAQNYTVTNSTPYEHVFVTGGATIQGQVSTANPPFPYFYLSYVEMLDSSPSGHQTRFLNVGDAVNGSSTYWSDGTVSSNMSSTDFGQGIKYVGFHFYDNGAIHYGWMKINLTGTESFVIVELAYNNTAGESINVGQQ